MAWSGILTGEVRWSGDVSVEGDVVVPAGATLRVEAGARVSFAPRPAWSCAVFRSAPEGWPIEATCRERCDIVVLGTLEVAGTAAAPAVLGGPDEEWGGVTWLGSGRGRLRCALILGPRDSGIQAFDQAELDCSDCRVEGGEKGLWLHGLSRVRWRGGALRARRWGALCSEGARLEIEDALVAGGGQGLSASGWALARARDCRFAEHAEDRVFSRDQAWVRSEGERDDCALA